MSSHIPKQLFDDMALIVWGAADLRQQRKELEEAAEARTATRDNLLKSLKESKELAASVRASVDNKAQEVEDAYKRTEQLQEMKDKSLREQQLPANSQYKPPRVCPSLGFTITAPEPL